MYSLVLTLHSWIRWIVLLLAVAAFGLALVGWLRRQAWSPQADRLGMALTMGLDIQILLGLILYLFLSPTTTGALKDLGTAMADAGTRYWVAGHVAGMLVALVLAHVGRALSRRATEAARKYRLSAIFYGLATVLIVLSIPWPFLPYGRPWVRL
jgi:hypothetical protein